MFALATTSDSLFVGGSFPASFAGSVNLARWDTISSTWNAVRGAGVPGPAARMFPARALAEDPASGWLYVGSFGPAIAGNVGIAKWDTASSTWSGLGSGVVSGDVRGRALDSQSGTLYVAGTFTSAGGVSGTSRIAKWDITTSTWTALRELGGSGTINALAFDTSSGSLYVGGDLTWYVGGELTWPNLYRHRGLAQSAVGRGGLECSR